MTPEEWEIILLSLKVSGVAVLATMPVAFGLAWLLARGRFPGKLLLDALVHLPLVLPPVVTGWLLLILFGMRWLRKAILRSVGVIALHDEDAAFSKETAELNRQASDKRADYLAGLAAFKAVLLEGVEVVFIVIAVGAAHGQTGYASLGALAALILVTLIGLVVHRPLARVPENALKFVVGLMLTSFGIFWTGEGIGAEWPGADLALLAIFAVIALASFAIVRWMRGTDLTPDRRAAR